MFALRVIKVKNKAQNFYDENHFPGQVQNKKEIWQNNYYYKHNLLYNQET